jgi:hypothetical protein
LPIRDRLVVRLGKEILGPREGPHERMRGRNGSPPPDPSDEYVVGVLEPKDLRRGSLAHFGRPILVSNQDVNRMDDEEKLPDEDEDYDYGAGPAEITPELDPRALPKSVGLSFVVNSEGETRISFCATWARYKRGTNYWQRVPFSFIQRDVTADRDASWKSDQDSGVTLHLRRIRIEHGIHVSLYLVNSTSPSGHYPKVEELVFQPQIRMVCQDGTHLLPIRGEEAKHDVEGFPLLYRERYAMARGHLCGAVWRQVDPEREAPSEGPEEIGPPFKWVDGEILSPTDRQMFTNPDVRSEYLPCYAVEQASLSGPPSENLGSFSAKRFADLWNSTDMDNSLKRVVAAYERWIAKQRRVASSLEQKYQETALGNLNACELTLRRMKEGLELLRTDSEVRLAFCFMNKAMHQQSIWKDRSKPLEWHLFQIAFILQCIAAIAREKHPDRSLCDLLWFPTGAGKTEAYLGLAAFTIALRRRMARGSDRASCKAGVSVISRYTLRLLTIQQFRRALSMITACEYLRMTSWLPLGHGREDNPWGTSRFSIGLWVGAGVTPNRLVDHRGFDPDRKRSVLYLGAVGELFGRHRLRSSGAVRVEGEESEPAQVLNCPACHSILAVSPTTLSLGIHEIHWIISCKVSPAVPDVSQMKPYRGLSVQRVKITPLPNGSSCVVSTQFRVPERSEIRPQTVDTWWEEIIKPAVDPSCHEEFTRASRPGYFFRHSGLSQKPVDFEIHCPDPSCDLNKVLWSEFVPSAKGHVKLPVLPPFRVPQTNGLGYGVPIPAYTVDDQVYGRCPSMIVGTVDKFARLSFEPRASALFGYVTHYDSEWGYYRENVPPETGDMKMGRSYAVQGFDPPTLIIQDELHLIEGPLGTMVGLYEAGIELLASVKKGDSTVGPKYIASTATIRQAHSQVQSLFNRQLAQFPPLGLLIDDSFFAITREPHSLESAPPGRLYLGVCAPGRGAQTPIIRIWSAILQEMAEVRLERGASDPETDQFWTLVGYFNAKRELAGAVGLYKQDIPLRLGLLATRRGRPSRSLQYIELSGRTESFEIPGKLDRLAKFPDNDVDALFATSMFGTGVDVDRLGLMVVHGQPKTTANYIQATGRVGRKTGGLIVTFLRATRPRDLDHYEFFVGYHRSLHRHVEPITVYPFSPRARERGFGPLSVLVLRNAREISGVPVPPVWGPEDRIRRGTAPHSGSRIMRTRRRSVEVQALVDALEFRAENQPLGRNPGTNICRRDIISELDRWEAFALQRPTDLVYYESTMTKEPSLPVVLGDPSHDQRNLPQVFRNTPQSLREVEATTTYDDEV